VTGAEWPLRGAIWKAAVALALLTILSNCAPLVGAAAVVGADEVAEQDGDAGLF
jgi:hypothetical protein